MRDITAIFAVILTVFITGGCKKEDTYYYVSSETKAWTLFYEGSFWIYRNDSTLVLDSTVIAGPPEFDFLRYSETDLDYYEYICTHYFLKEIHTQTIVYSNPQIYI